MGYFPSVCVLKACAQWQVSQWACCLLPLQDTNWTFWVCCLFLLFGSFFVIISCVCNAYLPYHFVFFLSQLLKQRCFCVTMHKPNCLVLSRLSHHLNKTVPEKLFLSGAVVLLCFVILSWCGWDMMRTLIHLNVKKNKKNTVYSIDLYVDVSLHPK